MSHPVQRLGLEGVSRRFGRRAAVDRVSLAVGADEIVCLLGPSGCGKSTTLRIAAGVERADEGRVLIGGMVAQDGRKFVPPERRGVGLMFQDFALFPHLSIVRNVMFGLDALPAREREARAMAELERVGLGHLAKNYPHQLSGGEQQRVALARALAPAPKLLLMDEPFSGLDERLRDAVRARTLAVLREKGAAALLVTHDPGEAMRIADRIALMRSGRIVQVGSPGDLYNNPCDAEAAAFFSDHAVIDGRVRGGRVETILGAFDAAGLSDGAAADVLVRPEAVAIVDEGGIRARVVSWHLVGADGLAVLQANGVSLSARTAPTPALAAGQEVLVAVDRSRVLVFAKAAP